MSTILIDGLPYSAIHQTFMLMKNIKYGSAKFYKNLPFLFQKGFAI